MNAPAFVLQPGDAGLLFPAISLLMLAYTNRYLGLASVARQLAQRYTDHADENLHLQVRSLMQRLHIIRHTQALGVLSLLSCTLCLGALFLATAMLAQICFVSALGFMALSLVFSLREIHLSVHAIGIHLRFLEAEHQEAAQGGK